MRAIGLIDLQVNGFAGVDFNDAALTPEAMDHALHAMLRIGVTCCLPTLITATEADLAARFAALDAAVANSRLGPLMVPGYHLEGPFLNPTPGYAGCHPSAAMVLPDIGLIRRVTAELRRPVLLLTVAPERDGASALIAWAAVQPMLVSMGHTAATAEDVARGVAAGLTLSTHLGNALPQPQPKFLNPMMAQLAEDRLHAGFIADGIHVPPGALKVMLRAKGLERSFLVTDATSAAATKPGLYPFAGMTIEHATDGSVREPGSSVLAGSGLCLDQAVRNVIAWNLAEPTAALALASDNPLALLAPVLARHGIVLPASSVTWSPDWHAQAVQLGDVRISAS
ncbi:MAG: N-acetylglucosamine-6-phosphate deacetylase [Acetobacteraceae bacterium]